MSHAYIPTSSLSSNNVVVDRNRAGFLESPEYRNFANTFDESLNDSMVYRSSYFGDVTGQIFGLNIDAAFENYVRRIEGREIKADNSGTIFTPATNTTNTTNTTSATSATSTSKLSGLYIGLLAVAALYFLG